MAIREASLGRDHRLVAFDLLALTEALLGLGRPSEALPITERIASPASAESAVGPLLTKAILGKTLLGLGHLQQAESNLRKALELGRANPRFVSTELAELKVQLGKALLAGVYDDEFCTSF